MKRLLLSAAIAAVAATVGVATPAPAHADQGGSEAAFLSALSGAGLTHRGAGQAISAGKAVCQLMDAGLSPTDTVLAVQETNPGFTLESAGRFAAISAAAFCPGHM